MRLSAFFYGTGYHVAAWRHPKVPADAGVNFRHYAEAARLAERGKFDFIFIPDSLASQGTDVETLSRTAIRYVAQMEPMTLLGGLAAVTSRIGLVASATTTYNEPYHVARMIASLDHLSGGRAGWNLVTSQNPCEAANFGFAEHPPHAARYARAREFLRVVQLLWDSWDDDAFLRDKENGIFFDIEKLHVPHHEGAHFSVRGPLNVPRPPQGHPVLVQSGSSDAGRGLAAEFAEVVFTAQSTLEGAQAFYRDVKQRAAAAGRASDQLLIMTGIVPFVGKTHREAQQKFEFLRSLIDPDVAVSLLARQLGGVDLSRFPLDSPLPTLPETNASKSRRRLLIDLANAEGLTIRELALRVAAGRGHRELIGTPAQVADELEEWIAAGGADGFNVMAAYLPGALEDFVELVIPELQARGSFRKDYTGSMLRDHLGLARPRPRRPTARR